jgi:protein-tyrosine phosphatase
MGDFHRLDGRAGEGLILEAGKLHLPTLPVARRAALWLLFLGPFFYASYGLANYVSSLRDSVTNIAMAWEKAIPFMAWTIIPYWSINAFYVATLFFNTSPHDVDRIAKRYLTCQLIAVACFILFPLRAIFDKPETSGLTGFMFDALGSFDKPFNQAPSLHIALLVIIWDHWRKRFTGWAGWVWHFWSALIGLSVLTTFQHHIMDIPTGALLGMFALWLFSGEASRTSFSAAEPVGKRRWKIAALYAAGSALFLCLAIVSLRLSPLALLWLWPSLALALVAAAYFRLGVAVFQKRADGGVSLAAFWLLMPYRWGAKVNAWAWTRGIPANACVMKNVYLGRIPKESEINGFSTVIDMTGEVLVPKVEGINVKAFPLLDLAFPPIQTLKLAAQAIQTVQENGKTLVCCALGMQRSAAAAAVWLCKEGHAKNGAQAIAILRRTGRPIHLDAALIDAALEEKP